MRGLNRCHECNRFFSYQDVDEYTHFGSSYSMEPPDPVFICGRCSKKMEDEMVSAGKIFYTPWLPGRCHRNAAKRLGWKFARPKGAAWGEFVDPSKQLPEGWVIDEWEGK